MGFGKKALELWKPTWAVDNDKDYDSDDYFFYVCETNT